MNVLELLDNELKNKNWTVEQKARYLYLRSCKLFSFDPRYKFCGIMTNGKELETKLRGYKFDLEDVENFEVVCTSCINNVYPRLLQEILGIEADPTCSDLTRVKMGLVTHGYYPTTKEYMYKDHLKQLDKDINYIKTEYQDEYLERQIKQQFEDYQREFPQDENDEFLIYKINLLQELLEKLECKLKNIADQEFCITYLTDKLNIDFRTIQLYQIGKQDHWHFYDIYITHLQNEALYYLLEPSEKGFYFYEIHKEEAMKYTKKLKGINKDILL